MVDNAFGDFFTSDADDEFFEEDDELIAPPVVVPSASSVQAAPVAPSAPVAQPTVQPAAPAQPISSAPVAPVQAPPVSPPVQAAATAVGDLVDLSAGPSREERLVAALNKLMEDSREIQASALVSLDGFTMASALPEGMQEDRVGAMSAAILGLGERAAVELGRGSLSQVIIEGNGGYVVLIAAGPRGALTCLAETDAKLGLVLYDMRNAAEIIAGILG